MASHRIRVQYCKVILATSLVWVLLDVFILMYYTDCGTSSSCNDDKNLKAAPITEPQSLLGRLIPNALKPSYAGPGENGKPVHIPKEKEAEMKEQFKINQFNLMASEMIALNRSLPDVRMDACKRKDYPNLDKLPDTSIVIVFHNEAWSTLLRTVHSAINRAPRHLLHEILLVDDASERDFLGRQLDEYVATLSVPTRVIRMPERTGLIRARLQGAAEATGKTLTFLDAHCECTEGWLEPLMNEIYMDRSSVVCPIIDVISDDTFEYITGSDMTWGGFNWKLNFRWYPVPPRETDRRHGDRSLPLRSPTMAGGLFSIHRDYFYEMGAYDPGMDIWGGENLEMSFRVWQCGGQVLISTCSRVGHVFRKVSPYTWPGGVVNILNHNTLRTVHVWMDEYKDFFLKINPSVQKTDYGDITERRQLREKLQCKSFKWYLENIYPESQMPLDYFSLGEVRNKESGQCLDSMGRKQGENVGLIGCHGMGGNQMFSFTIHGGLQTDDMCLDVAALTGPVRLYQCHGLGGNQLWQYDRQTMTLRHANSNQCLDKASPKERDMPSLAPCSGAVSQQWLLGDMNWDKLAAAADA